MRFFGNPPKVWFLAGLEGGDTGPFGVTLPDIFNGNDRIVIFQSSSSVVVIVLKASITLP